MERSISSSVLGSAILRAPSDSLTDLTLAASMPQGLAHAQEEHAEDPSRDPMGVGPSPQKGDGVEITLRRLHPRAPETPDASHSSRRDRKDTAPARVAGDQRAPHAWSSSSWQSSLWSALWP
jgi:hypothetical protein